MLYSFIIHCMAIILLIQVHYSKSVDSNFEIEEQSEKNSEDVGSEDNVGIHVSYRPKHKYKFGNGRESLKRFTEDDRSSSECEDENPMQYAIMFKNSEPVGILQPFEDSYRFLPVSGESTMVELNPAPLKEKKSLLDIIKPSESNLEANEDKADNKVGFIDDRYPAILAKFKIDSRVAANRHNMLKRATESTDITDSQLSSLKSTMAKVRSDDNVLVEAELKSILDDMGLIDDYPNREEKREVAENDEEEEDENLEIGTNKINLLKENPKDLREKREFVDKFKEESKCKYNLVDKVRTSETSKEVTEVPHEKVIKERSCPEKTTAVEEEFQEDVKEKRENIINDVRVSENDLPIEKSTLSTTNEELQEEIKQKRENIVNDVAVSENDLPIEKSTLSIANEEIEPYEKRIERDIRDKIMRLKEEVKKEMEELSNTRKPSDDTRRKKRQIMTNLVDEETKDIDPLNNDIENNKVHIRRKRDLNYEKEFLLTPNTMDGDIYSTLITSVPIPISRRRKRNADDEEYFKYDIEEFATDRSVEGTKIPKKHDGSLASQEMGEGNLDILDQSNFIFQPLVFDKRTCECKNGNCKCDKTKGNEHLESNSDNTEISDSDRNLSASQIENVNEAEDNEDIEQFEKETNGENSHKLRAPRKIKEGFLFTDGEYFIDQNPALLQLTPLEEVEGEDHLISLKGKSDSGNHLYALKRSMIPHSRFRRRTQTENNEPIQLIDMSAEELFGALPQSYEGELTRYKRVKRSKKKN